MTRFRRAGRRASGTSVPFPFFPVYPADWLSSGTRAMLTTEQRGIFWELAFHAWLAPDCMLPEDDETLAAYAGVSLERWSNIGRTVVQRAFTKRGQRLFNKRLLAERKIAVTRYRQLKRAGKASGEARAKTKKKRP